MSEDPIQKAIDRLLAQREALPEEVRREAPSKPPWYATAPVLKQGFQALGWLDEKVTKPFASLVTAPWSRGPDGLPLPWTEGESWFEHERREYDAWKSPRFVKGVVESLNPIYLIPVGGTIAKAGGIIGKLGVPGAKALVKAGQVVSFGEELPLRIAGKGLKSIMKTPVGKKATELASNAEILARNVKPNAFRKIAERVAAIPGGARVVRTIAGESALVGKRGEETAVRAVERKTGEAALILRTLNNENINRREMMMAQGRLVSNGDSMHLWGQSAKKPDLLSGQAGIAKVEVKPEFEGKASKAVNDVLEHPLNDPNYPYILTPNQKVYVQWAQQIGKDIKEMMVREGVWKEDYSQLLPAVMERVYVRRKAVGLKGMDITEEQLSRMRVRSPEMHRTAMEMITNMEKGVIYAPDTNRVIQEYIDWAFRKVAVKRFVSHVPSRTLAVEEDILRQAAAAKGRKAATDNAVRILKNASRGMGLKGGQIGAIRRNLPELANEIEQALAINPGDVPKIIKGVSKDVYAGAKITPEQLEQALISRRWKEPSVKWAVERQATAQEIQEIAKEMGERALFPQERAALAEAKKISKLAIPSEIPITHAEIKAALKELGIKGKESQAWVEQIYTESFKTLSAERQGKLAELLTKSQGFQAEVKAQTKQIKDALVQARKDAKPHWATLEDGTIVPESMINRPFFGGHIFPEPVAKEFLRIEGDAGNRVFEAASKISSVGRMVKATTDFSAPFIQGLPLLAQDPIKWMKTTVAHYQAFLSPNVVNKFYMENWDELMEMVSYGGHVGGTEFYASLGGIQTLAGRLPGKIGEMSEKAITQTFGRFGASFGYFGDMARLEIWRGLRENALRQGDDLADLGRLVNRMTGISSAKGIGIGATQRQLENGWFAFAPNYLRAGLSYSADVFKGGMTGRVARTNLGRLMAGGAAFYVGISLALGQEPNLDPRSGKFGTIKIGNRHIGVGGITYGLARLAGNIAVSAKDKPIDLVNLTTLDSPFTKFWYNRSSVLSSNVVQAVRQRNFMGEPLETPGDYAAWVAEQMSPIAVSDAVREGLTPAAIGLSELGLRTFPKSAGELRNARRLELINKMSPTEIAPQQKAKWESGKLEWAELTTLQKDKLEQDELLARLTKEVKTRVALVGGVEQKTWAKWEGQKDTSKAEYLGYAEDLQEGLASGELSFSEARTLLKSAAERYRYQMEGMEKNPDYKGVYDWFAEEKPEHIVDLENALNDWERTMYGTEGLEDKFGRYDFSERERREQQFIQRWGLEAYDYVQQTYAAQPSPWLLDEIRDVKEYLKPYWDLRDGLLASNPRAQAIDQLLQSPTLSPENRKLLQRNPFYNAFEKRLELAHKGMRIKDPTLDALLYIWYNDDGNRTWASLRGLKAIQTLEQSYREELAPTEVERLASGK